jgi:hypothetical protein
VVNRRRPSGWNATSPKKPLRGWPTYGTSASSSPRAGAKAMVDTQMSASSDVRT